MNQDSRNHAILPSIKPDADEVSSYRKSGRSDAPKQSSFNGILVFVLFLMVIVMGFGGYVLYEVQKKLVEANALLSTGQESILELEGRLAATGTDVSKTLQEMQDQSCKPPAPGTLFILRLVLNITTTQTLATPLSLFRARAACF